MRIAHRILSLAGALLVAAYFLGLVWPGLTVYFSPDDTMNLYKPWTSSTRTLVLANLVFFRSWPIYRPLASAWYAAMFHIAGFHPLPFHAVYTAIFLTNIFLTYAVARRLSGSRDTGAATALLGSYHHSLTPLFLDTAYIFDALCYSFYFAALLLYLRARSRTRQLTGPETAGLCLLYVFALNSKEIAVTLPAMLLVYELVYRTPKSWRQLPMLLRAPAIASTGLITLIFIIGRSLGSESLVKMAAYRPVFTVARFLETSRNFFGETFFRVENLNLVTIWVILLLIAWVSGSSVLRFAWLFLMLAPLPVAFIPPRGPSQYYIPWFGCMLFASATLVNWIEALTARVHLDWLRGAVLLPALALILYPYYKSQGWDNATTVSLEAPVIRDTVAQLHALYPQLAPGSRLLFHEDPFKPDRSDLTFLVRESYGDDSLQVFRSHQKDSPADESQPYDYVFDYRGGRFFEGEQNIPAPPVPLIVTADGLAEIFHQGWTRVTPKAPARPGEVVIAKAISLGSTVPAIPADKPFPRSPLLPVRSPVEVRVAGRPAEVRLKIGWPEMVDTYRVDFRVPALTARGAVPVEISASGVTGPPVSMPME